MDREQKYKKTILIESDDDKALKDAAEHLRNGEVIGFPTETVYGLGCDAGNGEAVKRVFEAKGRPADTRTEAQKVALLKLLKQLRERFPRALITGHNVFNPMKKCPCFDAVKEYEGI